MGLEPAPRHLARAPRAQVSWLLGMDGSIPAAPRSLRTGPCLGQCWDLPHCACEGSRPINLCWNQIPIPWWW